MRLTFAQVLAAPIVIESYPMPIKRGASIDAAVINPLVAARTDEQRRRIINRYDQFLAEKPNRHMDQAAEYYEVPSNRRPTCREVPFGSGQR